MEKDKWRGLYPSDGSKGIVKCVEHDAISEAQWYSKVTGRDEKFRYNSVYAAGQRALYERVSQDADVGRMVLKEEAELAAETRSKGTGSASSLVCFLCPS